MSAEEFVFDEKDDGEGDGPVAQEGDKIVDDGLEFGLAGNREDGDDDGDEQRPDEAGDSVEIVSEQLEGKTAGVVDGDVVSEDGECEDYEAELGPAYWVVYFIDEAPQGVIVVGVGVRGILRQETRNTDGGTDCDRESGWNHHAEPRK